ncbi:MAG: hypothetical protein OXR66_01595 [Candidatus Woesearchaeota archaeon]|nr:hypothetical protein [Candidatus Woesearchaeota archaeon]
MPNVLPFRRKAEKQTLDDCTMLFAAYVLPGGTPPEILALPWRQQQRVYSMFEEELTEPHAHTADDPTHVNIQRAYRRVTGRTLRTSIDTL